MTLTSLLYKMARASNTVSKLGSPKKTARRIKNRFVGRLIAKMGVWK